MITWIIILLAISLVSYLMCVTWENDATIAFPISVFLVAVTTAILLLIIHNANLGKDKGYEKGQKDAMRGIQKYNMTIIQKWNSTDSTSLPNDTIFNLK